LTCEILLDHVFELPERHRIHIEFPLQILTHLALHLIDFSQLEHTLDYNTPGFVGVSVVTDNLGCEHESGYKKTVTRRSPSSGEARFESLKEDEGSEGYRRMELCPVKCVRDEMGELYL